MRKITFIIGLLACVNSMAQVSLQSGAAVQNFPLIDYTDEKAGLSLNLGLSYNSGNGLLVNDIASDAGTGFHIDAGGVIMRLQAGSQPDDQKAYFTGDSRGLQSLKNYADGYMYNPNIGKGCNTGGNYYPVFRESNGNDRTYKEHNIVAADMEQDRFMFRFNGRFGTFIISRNLGNDNWKVTTLGDTRLKISFTTEDMTAQGIRTRISRFSIISEDGVKYTFSDKALTRICRYKLSGINNTGQLYPVDGEPNDGANELNRYYGYPVDIGERPFVVNAWYLSEIENTNTGAKVGFNYKSDSHDIISGKQVTHLRDLNKTCGYSAINRKNECGRMWFQNLSNPGTAESFTWDVNQLSRLSPGPTSVLYIRAVLQVLRLMQVNLPNGGVIKMEYEAKERADLPGAYPLRSIEYWLDGKIIRGYRMEHAYMFKNAIRPLNTVFNASEAKFARLCLTSIQKTGNGEDEATEPPYRFDYYTGSNKSDDDIVPARNFLAQDHWGFYNGKNADLPLTEDHDLFTYENPYFKSVLARNKNPKPGLAKNGLLKAITFPTGGKLNYEYQQNKPGKNVLPAQYEQLGGGVSVSKTTYTDDIDVSKSIINEYSYVQLNGNSSHWGDEKPVYHSLNVTEYNEKWVNKLFRFPGITYPEMTGGQVQVWKLIAGAATGVAISIGINALMALIIPAEMIPVVNIIVTAIVITKLVFDATKTYEFHRFTLSNNNIVQSNPLGGTYSRVEVKTNSPQAYNGKTVYEFTDPSDQPLLVPNAEWPYVANQRYASWAYGLPKKTTIYDKDNNVVKTSKTDYKFIVSKLAETNNLNCNCATQNKRSKQGFQWIDKNDMYFTWNQVHWMVPRAYYPYTGRTDVENTQEDEYKNGSIVYTSSAKATTDPATLLQKSKVVRRDVKTLTQEVNYYATDFNLPGAIDKMKQSNAIHTPVATEKWILTLVTSGTNPRYDYHLADATVTEYKLYTFGGRQEVKPWKTYALKTTSPIPSATIGFHNPALLIRKPEYYQLTGEFAYDTDGNLIEKKSFEQQTAFIYDYKNRYQTATVSNASNADIAYAGFEADGTGNWSYSQTSVRPNEGLTGLNAFRLNAGSPITRNGLNASLAYYITCWKKDDVATQLSVNGQAGEMLYEANGWKLYRYEISNANTVTVTGDVLIDELRLYPKNSLIATVAYKNGVGKISECDANNRITFYEYDALNRIKLIRDQNRNVIKTFEYNYKR